MLHKNNTGKYFSKKYLKLRRAGLKDRDNLDDSEENYADIEFPNGGGRTDKRTYVLHSIYKGKKYDIRNRPR